MVTIFSMHIMSGGGGGGGWVGVGVGGWVACVSIIELTPPISYMQALINVQVNLDPPSLKGIARCNT